LKKQRQREKSSLRGHKGRKWPIERLKNVNCVEPHSLVPFLLLLLLLHIPDVDSDVDGIEMDIEREAKNSSFQVQLLLVHRRFRPAPRPGRKTEGLHPFVFGTVDKEGDTLNGEADSTKKKKKMMMMMMKEGKSWMEDVGCDDKETMKMTKRMKRKEEIEK